MSPCKCGHELHWRRQCSECACTVACPDHVEGARRAGRKPSRSDERVTAELVELLSWRDPNGETVSERVCAYCEGTFQSPRSHRDTCSSACRKAKHVALKYAHDSDVPGPYERRESYSEERRRATGWGNMTPNEQERADLRVRAAARGATA